jgi:Ser/Thr protein kinase RdoA (MazF antagonist)
MVFDATPLTLDIVDAVVRHWDVSVNGPGERLHGGEESSAYRVDGNVIRIGPDWRSDEELEWAYAIASHAADTVPEALAPLRTPSGAAVVRVSDRPISVWPYRAGQWADDDDDATYSQAADLLARVHRALATMSPPPRPGPGPSFADAPELDDHALDAWLADFDATHHERQPLHGDFYAGNMLVDDGRIIALLDWDETLISPPERELAWAAWEWADGLSSLDLDDAREFMDEYREAGGTARPVDEVALRQLVRDRLRREVRYSRACRLRGLQHDEDDHEYEARQIEVFFALRP